MKLLRRRIPWMQLWQGKLGKPMWTPINIIRFRDRSLFLLNISQTHPGKFAASCPFLTRRRNGCSELRFACRAGVLSGQPGWAMAEGPCPSEGPPAPPEPSVLVTKQHHICYQRQAGGVDEGAPATWCQQWFRSMSWEHPTWFLCYREPSKESACKLQRGMCPAVKIVHSVVLNENKRSQSNSSDPSSCVIIKLGYRKPHSFHTEKAHSSYWTVPPQTTGCIFLILSHTKKRKCQKLRWKLTILFSA